MELQPHPVIPKKKPVLVCILDGWGENAVKDEYNACHVANTPTMDKLRDRGSKYYRSVQAHGKAVGLPTNDDMGNSEVGHNALGAGKIIAQGASLVDISLEKGTMFTDAGWNYIKPAFASNTLHLIALLSNGGVHSRYDQLLGVMKGAVKDGCKRMRLHILTDGRDVPDGTCHQYLETLQKDLDDFTKAGCDAKVGSGGGRMAVTMDRYEADWGMVERGYNAHILGEAEHKFTDAATALKTLKTADVSDQYIPAFVIVDEAGAPVGAVEDGDAVVCCNFRADRVVEISKALEYENFDSFHRKRFPKMLYAGMMQYDGDLHLPTNYLVPPPLIERTSGEYFAKNGLRTFACSETQKFGHVTFFWNGNRSGYFDEALETFVQIPSDNCQFNEKPLMKAREITAAGKEAMISGKYDVVRVNYANPDMVGHTGDLAATIAACEECDACLKELLDLVEEMGGVFLVTADHGNADDMVQRSKKKECLKDADGNPLPLTSHTLAPVPVAIGGPGLPESVELRDDLPEAGLANITGTYINLMGYLAPDEMEPSLIKW